MKSEDVNTIPQSEETEDGFSRKLDEKLMELQSLFEVSQTLNSSLNLKSILDNMLLTPMGKMMISRGIVLLYQADSKLRIETLKGFSPELIGKYVDLKTDISELTFIETLSDEQKKGVDFFNDKNIILIIPIRSSDQTLGFIGFGKKLLNTKYSKSESQYLKSLSNIAATSIENGLMVRRLQEINRRLDKKIQELNTIFEIGKELNSTLDPDKILNLLSYAVMGEMIVNRCLIFLNDEKKVYLAMSKGLRDDENQKDYHNSNFMEKLFELTEPQYLKPFEKYNKSLNFLQNSGFRIVVPMRIQNVTKGVLVIGERITKMSFKDDDLEFLSTLGNEALICLENARLFEEQLEKKRIEEELALAREIQQRLLPSQCPQVENYQIDGINVSSLHVSGDYFDCIRMDEDHICVAIADVSGKGTPASLLMANLQAILNALIETKSSIKEITFKINNLIHKNTNHDKFITFFLGILDLSENSFSFVNAGHNPPYLMHQNGELEMLEEGGLLLGMLPNMPYEQSTVTLKSGDWIIMFTDGVTEAKNKEDEDFDEKRLIEVMQKNKAESANTMKNAILTTVKDFTGDVPQSDDITLVILKAL